MDESDGLPKDFLVLSKQLENHIDQDVRISQVSAVLFYILLFAGGGLWFASSVTFTLGSPQ